MRVLDIDLDYFLNRIPYHIPDNAIERLPDEEYSVWSKEAVELFIHNNLGLSEERKIKGRIIQGHNESIGFWKELIRNQMLTMPFDVIHIDSHADLGLGYCSWAYIINELLKHPVVDRPQYNSFYAFDRTNVESIGDYMLFAIAYRWISKITYCANPNGKKDDYIVDLFKDGHRDEYVRNEPIEKTIQLFCNPAMEYPYLGVNDADKTDYFKNAIYEPEVPMIIIPTIESVRYSGDFDYITIAQSPNYTPQSADFIIDIFRKFIHEC